MEKKISGMILRDDVAYYQSHAKDFSPAGNMRMQRISERAQEYFELFSKNKLLVNPSDYPTFAEYIDAFADDNKEELLTKMRESTGFDAKTYLQENSGSSDKLARKVAPKLSIVARKDRKENTETESKARILDLKNWMQRGWHKTKVAVVTAAVVLVGWLGVKNDSHSRTLEPQKAVAVKTVTPKKAVNNSKTIDMKAKIAMEKNKKVYQNFYNTKLEIMMTSAKRDALYQQVNSQLKKGIFTLPDSMVAEQVAYIDAMHKAYGLASPVSEALTSSQKLSAEQQAQLVKDLSLKDSQIKAKALSAHGQLGNHSSFDKAKPALQKQHIKNLKQLRDMKRSAVKQI